MTYFRRQAQAETMEYLIIKYVWDQNMFLQDHFFRQVDAMTVVAVNDDKINNRS